MIMMVVVVVVMMVMGVLKEGFYIRLCGVCILMPKMSYPVKTCLLVFMIVFSMFMMRPYNDENTESERPEIKTV